MDVFWALLLSLLSTFLLYKYSSHNRKNLPPGPWNLPIVGYLPFLDPKHPYLTLTGLARKYGPVYGLYLGNIYTVVISDAKMVKKIFNKDGASGRAPLHLTHGIMNGYGLICAEGGLWRDQRKFVHNTLRTMGASRIGQNRTKMQDLISANVSELVQFIANQGTEVTLDPLELLRHNLGSVINTIVFGKSWSRDDPTWKWLQHLQEEGTKRIGVAGPLNFLPFLRFLPKSKQTLRFLIEGKLETHKIYQQLIREEVGKKSESPNNFIQAFLSERKKCENEERARYYVDPQFHHLLADIFGASLDTTLTTLRWFLLFLAVNEDIQEKLRRHLIEILGDSLPTLEDMSSLPYMEATIAESQRIRSVVPVGIPHGTTEKIETENYQIPKGTMIVPLQWAIHMDSKIWADPEIFKPERFIGEEGKFSKPESFIPFQAGKRMCVGDELARMFLFLYGASLVKNFRIRCRGDVDLRGDCGITLTPKPHELIFTRL